MNLKKIGAIAAGTAMVGATLAGGAAAQVTDTNGDEVPSDFFVEDGQLNTKIVVGSQAAAADVKAASDIGLALGNKLYTEESVSPDVDVTVTEDTTSEPLVYPVYSNFYEDTGENVTTTSQSQLTDNWYNMTDERFNATHTNATWNSAYEAKIQLFDRGQMTTDTADSDNELSTYDLDYFVNTEVEIDTDDVSTNDNGDTYAPKDANVIVTPNNISIPFARSEITTDEKGFRDDVFGATGEVVQYANDGLEAGDSFEVFDNKYNILTVDNETNELEFGSDLGMKWGETGDTLTFGDYEIQLIDISVNEDQVLIEISNADGDTVTETLDTDGSFVAPWDGVRVYGHNAFTGIEGNNQAQLSLTDNVVTYDTPTDVTSWPEEGWNANFTINGDYVTWVNLDYVGDPMDGNSVEFLDYMTIDYMSESHEMDRDGDDTDELAFQSWIDMSFPETSEVVEDPEDGFGDVYTLETSTSEVMSKVMNPVTESMTVLDEDVDLDNVESNLILVGGPVANSVTEALVDEGVSEVSWSESAGELEYVEYGGYNHLIVAGQTRDETQDAAVSLMQQLAEN